MTSRFDRRLAASALGVSATAMAALYAGREEIAYPVLGGALLLLAAAALTATPRDRRGVVVVAPVADISAIAAGHRGVSVEHPPAIEAA